MITFHSIAAHETAVPGVHYWFSTAIEALRRRPALALEGPPGTHEALGECVLHRGCVILTELGNFCKTKRVRKG